MLVAAKVPSLPDAPANSATNVPCVVASVVEPSGAALTLAVTVPAFRLLRDGRVRYDPQSLARCAASAQAGTCTSFSRDAQSAPYAWRNAE